MRSNHLLPAVTALSLLLASLTSLFAHEGPEHDIAELTELMSKHGETADLLTQRAVEYQVLGKHAEAARDLERAVHLEPRLLATQRELSRAYFALGKTNEALQTVSRALRTAVEQPGRSSLLVVRAEILRARKDNAKALEDLNAAILGHPGNVDWHLARSQVQASLKLTKERVSSLEQGIQESGSGVLQTEWVEALIADGQHSRALERIELELKASRWKSSWQIRRAKVHLATAKPEQAMSDLKAALAELERRINPAAPDPSLLVDRGLVHELLGNKADARKDYELARSKGFNEESVRERIEVLKVASDE